MLNCPVCNYAFDFKSALRVANPLKVPCPQCAAVSRLDIRGIALHVAGAAQGAVLGATALVMVIRGVWSPTSGLIFALGAAALVTFILDSFGYGEAARLELRKRPTYKSRSAAS
jgi:hypothetical protein